jgi:hypothetical protein
MQYQVKLEATVEAQDAEAARALFNDQQGVVFSDVDVIPTKQWAVSVDVQVTYTFDLTVNAESEDEAEQIATNEIECLEEIEGFVMREIVTEHQYEVDNGSIVVRSVESIEDDEDDDEDDEPAVSAVMAEEVSTV